MRTICVTLALAWASLAAAGDAKAPVLTIQGNHVIASSFRPGSTIVFYSVALVGDGYSTATKTRNARVTDDDHDGTVVFDVPEAMPFRSVWIAVDEANGDYAVSSPAGYFRKNGSQPELRKHGAAVDELAIAGHVTYLLYVHPGKGAWTAFAVDGGDDSDGKVDYVTSINLSALRPLQPDNHDKPTELKAGGTLFIVDGYDLRTSALKLDGAMLNGAH
jgi:hypothetical protein